MVLEFLGCSRESREKSGETRSTRYSKGKGNQGRTVRRGPAGVSREQRG